MKKIFLFVGILIALGVWFFVKATQAVPVNEIQDDKIYVFIQSGCPHCWAAEKYLKEKHPNLKVELRDISEERNRMMFFGCGAKFGLNKLKMGTPLFCMGKNYILGWDSTSEKVFDDYAKDFLPRE